VIDGVVGGTDKAGNFKIEKIARLDGSGCGVFSAG
jgi:hypothetical protein